MIKQEEIKRLKKIANKIRTHIIKMVSCAQSGHPGGSLSATDIMTALFFNKLRFDPKNPNWEDRDRFVLSKGHCTPVYYAVLAENKYFAPELLQEFRQMDSCLQGHPSRCHLPGIEISTGSLGQGLSIANGMALGLRLNQSSSRVYVLMGDGELQEGMIWEAAMTSAHYEIDNLTVIVDRNHQQIDGMTKDIMNLEPLVDKWKAFGWEVFVVDGHNFKEILTALDNAEKVKSKPSIILAKTVKGKGVSFMEYSLKFHGSPPNPKETELALEELNKND